MLKDIKVLLKLIDKIRTPSKPTKIILVGTAVVGIVYVADIIITNILTGFNSSQQSIVEQNQPASSSGVGNLIISTLPIIMIIIMLGAAIRMFFNTDEF